MPYLKSALDRKKNELEQLLKALESQEKRIPPSRLEGTVGVSTYRGHYHYYVCQNDSNKKGRKQIYVQKKQIKEIKIHVQNCYIKKLRKTLEKQLYQVKHLDQVYDPDSIADVFEKLHPGKQLFINPLVIPNSKYIENWAKMEYEKAPYDFGETEYYTERDERVRSKTEMIIADRLHRCGIPYHYEMPLVIRPGVVLYPDFHVMNVRTREIFIWEHFGKMSDLEYVSNVLLKLETYASAGFYPGKNLIFTFENGQRPLNVKLVMRMIEEYLI